MATAFDQPQVLLEPLPLVQGARLIRSRTPHSRRRVDHQTHCQVESWVTRTRSMSKHTSPMSSLQQSLGLDRQILHLLPEDVEQQGHHDGEDADEGHEERSGCDDDVGLIEHGEVRDDLI